MGLYLYCLGPADLPPPPGGLHGLDGAPVLRLRTGSFQAWISPLGECPSVTLERVRCHDRVVRAADSPRATALPARFGQWFDSADALRADVRHRTEALRPTLEALRGAVEFGVRIVDSAPPSPETEVLPCGGGRAYLEELARRHAAEREARERERRVADAMAAHLGATIRRQHVARVADGRAVAGLAHLVPRNGIGPYHRRLDAFRALHPELVLLATGPWPPYSFAA